MTIEIDNRDTENVHIDTYGYFTSESVDKRLDNLNYATIVHIFNNCIDSDDYNITMYEYVHEVYSENTTIEKVK